uniref:Protein-glutamine gamma-glutamyltransferase 2 n=1 Tax=Sparus aurata TaxID=8175 RepID=A0A671TVI6_SPAAU
IEEDLIFFDFVRCDLDIKSNSSSHHTELYGEERLIVRRGQPFNIILHLKPGRAVFLLISLSISVSKGPLPRKGSDTKVSFGLHESTVDTEWSASATHDPSGNTLSVSISSSPNAPIGRYSLTLDQEGQTTSLGEFILLFNAWCPSDAVYMKSNTKKQEYVLAQHGQVYRGTHKRIKGLCWNFGQFDPSILDICLTILDANPKFAADADKDCSARRNPIYVTRVISAMINSNDDRGVLVGNWGEVTDGVHPGRWMGSGDILRQWAESGPVRYGQCWVFAAVACTVSRALGIPCRVVTNFGSAHDTDANLIIENVYNVDGEKISRDSVWNFHVWVDSWMTRPDLGSEFDGWQTSDPTPQERSDGVFCCGPAPLKAIREGELTKKYDTPFIFAEVNADVVDLVQRSSGETVKFAGSTTSVGRSISTKAVGSDERWDITHQYKYPEGSKEERKVFEKAQHNNKLQQQGEEPSLRLKIKLADNMIVGKDFEVSAVLTNNCTVAKTCTLMFMARAVGYNATRGQGIEFVTDIVEVAPGEELKVKRSVTAQLTLLNTLPERLRDCSFTIEGVGLTDGKPITENIGTVEAKQEAKASISFIPTSVGSSKLLVNFDSDKLKNIRSFINVVVEK